MSLVHRAAAVVHAAAGLSATGGRSRARMTVRRKRGQLLLQLCGVTLGTLGLLPAEDDGFELVTAFGTKIFENRHDHSLKTIRVCGRPSPAIMVEVAILLTTL